MTIIPDSYTIRVAQPADVPTIFRLIQALADYEQLSHEVVGTPSALHEHLFGPQSIVEVLLVEQAAERGAESGSRAVGFALFFQTYSTYRTQPGLYLEDLFVEPDHRRCGLGKGLLVRLAQRAVEQGFPFVEWSVLAWNTPAIAFYERIGAVVNPNRRVCRLTGDGLTTLAERFSAHQPKDVTLRPVDSDGVIALFQLIQSSAAFHGAPDQVIGTMTNLRQHLFSQSPAIEALVAQQRGTVGIATFSQTYSTFLTQPGMYLEDLFVATDKRRQGIGRSLLGQVAQIAADRQCGRLEWLVQQWNENAIAFYQRQGATVLPDWRRCQLSDHALHTLANAGF